MRANNFLQNRSGIYGIRNIIDNKIYVGKTKCMYKRCHQYIYDFRNRSLGHINDYLYFAFSKYKLTNFEFFPLEFCEIDMCSERELYWIKKLKSNERKTGYNLRMDSSTGMIAAKETSIKISKNLKKQWASGVRKDHSSKLKNHWNNNDSRRKQQSKLLSRIKTKYQYVVKHPNGFIETCDYKRLVDLNLKNCQSNFSRTDSNTVTHKGFIIQRQEVADR